MAITSEIIGKLGGGAGVESVPVSGSASGGSAAALYTVQVPAGETWLVAVTGTITAQNPNVAYAPYLGIGDIKVTYSGVGGVSAVATGTTQITLTRKTSIGSDSFTGHLYTVKL